MGQTTSFQYDGNGNLVKKTHPNGSKTIYAAGGLYEVDKASGGSVTETITYYPAAGAMRINSTLYYVLKDHLGSASVITDSSGNIVGEQRYYPFGETRLSTGSIFTDKLYTSQREMTGLGIYHYNARFYSPKIGRFLSADTIVPGAGNPQAFSRYSYVLNNPLKYIDPSGHGVDCGIGMGCAFDPKPPPPPPGSDYCATHPGACGVPTPPKGGNSGNNTNTGSGTQVPPVTVVIPPLIPTPPVTGTPYPTDITVKSFPTTNATTNVVVNVPGFWVMPLGLQVDPLTVGSEVVPGVDIIQLDPNTGAPLFNSVTIKPPDGSIIKQTTTTTTTTITTTYDQSGNVMGVKTNVVISDQNTSYYTVVGNSATQITDLLTIQVLNDLTSGQ